MKAFLSVGSLLSLFFAGFAHAAPDAACQAAYQDLYGKNEIRIGVYFGYSEYEDHVGDGEEKQHLVDTLLAPCDRGQFNCGFKKVKGSDEYVVKIIRGPRGIAKRIYVRMLSSSVTSNHEQNLNEKAAEQKAKSARVEAEFQRSLAQDDMVFYSGHARYGTGITFTPMGYKEWNEALRTNPALDRMVRTLKSTQTPPKVIGLVACKSEEYYAQAIHQASPGSALILTRQTLQANDSVRMLDAALDSLLGMKCQQEFRKSLSDSTQFFYYNPYSLHRKRFGDMVPEIYNFFEPVQKSFRFSPNVIKNEVINAVEKARRAPPEERDDADFVGPVN